MNELTITDRFVFFWGGWPSQWHRSRFLVAGVEYNCCEQFMMAEKARVFGDSEHLAKILAASNPRQQKALGRKVRGFDEEVWRSVCRGIVYHANLAKYTQDAGLREKLLATEDRMIVEASPKDRIWGIGLAADDPRAADPSQWRGTNWLGIAITQARDSIRARPWDNPDPPLDAELSRQIEARRRYPK